MRINPLLLVDFYKVHHNTMYPKGMTKLYSNLTPRKSRIKGVDKVVMFGLQHFILEYLIKAFNENFFYTQGRKYEDNAFFIRSKHNVTEEKNLYLKQTALKKLRDKVIDEYKRHNAVDTAHIEALWDLGYLPIEIKALDEGTLCPIGVPMLTITNTHPDFAWLVNYLETLMSCMLWQSITSATIAHEYKKILTNYAKQTDEKNLDFVQWQGHDFSMRGMSSVETAILSGMAHLAVGFTGTDTIPAIYQLEESYKATGLIGASVPATEHSVMCMGKKETEIETFNRLLELYPTGILSVVSDTWDLWKVCTEYLPTLKDKILKRDGKLVIRPDSGNPVDIICGTVGNFVNTIHEGNGEALKNEKHNTISLTEEIKHPRFKGVIELLWDVFGGTVNEQGYKVLDPHIGCIYGDGIGLHNLVEICERLKAKGFASTNVVFGFGSYGYQYNTRDTFGFAVKATYGEILSCEHKDCTSVGKCMDSECGQHFEAREIFKDPITDDGTKKSKKGLLRVCMDDDYSLYVKDQCTLEEEKGGALSTVFKDGKLIKETTLEEIRNKLIA